MAGAEWLVLNAGSLSDLEYHGRRRHCDIPNSWTRATMLTRLEFCTCDGMSLQELQTEPKLKSLVFYR